MFRTRVVCVTALHDDVTAAPADHARQINLYVRTNERMRHCRVLRTSSYLSHAGRSYERLTSSAAAAVRKA